MKSLLFTLLISFTGLNALAEEITPVNLDGDISGEYKMSGLNEGDKREAFSFFIVKTPFKVKDSAGKEINFYAASSALVSRFGSSLFGFYVEQDNFTPGGYRLHWWLVSKGKPIDGENHMLLEQKDNTLVFGGDSEERELFRMEKVSNKQF